MIIKRKHKKTVRLIRRNTIEFINALTKFNMALSELAIISKQNKCLSCNHNYEKKEFKTGGIVSNSKQEIIVHPPVFKGKRTKWL